MECLLKYRDLKNDFPIFFYLYQRVKKEGLNKQDITVMVKSQQQQLKDLEHRVYLYNDFIRGQELQKQQLEQDIAIKEIDRMIKSFCYNIGHNFGVCFNTLFLVPPLRKIEHRTCRTSVYSIYFQIFLRPII